VTFLDGAKFAETPQRRRRDDVQWEADGRLFHTVGS